MLSFSARFNLALKLSKAGILQKEIYDASWNAGLSDLDHSNCPTIGAVNLTGVPKPLALCMCPLSDLCYINHLVYSLWPFLGVVDKIGSFHTYFPVVHLGYVKCFAVILFFI